jgi:hypothetical protein
MPHSKHAFLAIRTRQDRLVVDACPVCRQTGWSELQMVRVAQAAGVAQVDMWLLVVRTSSVKPVTKKPVWVRARSSCKPRLTVEA